MNNLHQRNIRELQGIALDAWSLLHKDPPKEGWCHLEIRFSVSAKHLELEDVEVRYSEDTPDGFREFGVSVPRKNWRIGLKSMFKTAMMEFRANKKWLTLWERRIVKYPEAK